MQRNTWTKGAKAETNALASARKSSVVEKVCRKHAKSSVTWYNPAGVVTQLVGPEECEVCKTQNPGDPSRILELEGRLRHGRVAISSVEGLGMLAIGAFVGLVFIVVNLFGLRLFAFNAWMLRLPIQQLSLVESGVIWGAVILELALPWVLMQTSISWLSNRMRGPTAFLFVGAGDGPVVQQFADLAERNLKRVEKLLYYLSGWRPVGPCIATIDRKRVELS